MITRLQLTIITLGAVVIFGRWLEFAFEKLSTPDDQAYALGQLLVVLLVGAVLTFVTWLMKQFRSLKERTGEVKA